ncbi:SH3 domain-containing protein [Amycolatopsis sp. cmx-11-12]|uniref:SH3 domain-containing protein n=1 Tax=Amycolatopsis sp. cmx-11-12 TaxID=2785795 RepID=UPI003917C22E
MKRVAVITAFTGAVAGGVLAGPAVAGELGSSDPAIAALDCKVKGRVNAGIYVSPDASSGKVGTIPKDKTAAAACTSIKGESYTACGAGTNNRWVQVNYKGTEGWAASRCVKWVAP